MKKLFELKGKITQAATSVSGGVACCIYDENRRGFGIGLLYGGEFGDDQLESFYTANVEEFDLDSVNYEGKNCFIDVNSYDIPMMQCLNGKVDPLDFGFEIEAGKVIVNGKTVDLSKTYEKLYTDVSLDFQKDEGTITVYGLEDGERTPFENEKK